MVTIFGGMRNFEYGSEEAVQSKKNESEEVVQPSKKGEGSVSEPKKSAKEGGNRGASVSQSSPGRSRKSKRVEAKTMVASPEKVTRRGTPYGSPVASPEKVTRRGTPYGGSTPSPRQMKKQKVTGGSTRNSKTKDDDVDDVDDREECPQKETKELNPRSEEEEFGDIGDDGTLALEDGMLALEDGRLDVEEDDGFAGIEEGNCGDLGLHFGEEARNDDCEVDEDEGDDYAWDEDKIPDPMSSDDENEEEMIPAEAYRADTDPEELLLLGKVFSDAEDFKHTCLRYTLKTRYNIKFYRSSSLKMGAKCAAEMRDDESPCPWMVYCSYDRRKQKLMVKTYVNDHRCEKTGHSRILKRSAIASLFAERLRLNPKITAKEIQAEILREYKMEVKENSCIKAKTKLMRERRKTHEEHFDKIWDYQAEIFRSNPGSTMDIETIPGATVGSKQRFYRLYMCFQAQKESWKKTCRPVIGLDGAFLKWDIKGQLLAAVGRDGDNRIVPIAWAVVEIENDTNWDWFVQHLAMDLGLELGKGFVVMSDKQKGLVKAVHNLLPEAEHRQCCRHIYENWRKGGKDLRLQKFFWYIARCYTPGMFNYNMDELKRYDPGAHASLVKTKPETWSRAFFKIGSNCNDNLNNLCESFNKTIREARKKPLLDMLEEIRRQCMTRNYLRSKMATARKTRFTEKTQKELARVEEKSKECTLRWAIGPETEVEDQEQTYVVSLERETCACRSWQMNGIPCIHAAKVILGAKRKLSEFVAPCYTTNQWRETYSYGISPLNGMIEWPQTNRLGVIPPPNRNGKPGRPKNHDRKKGTNETVSTTKLSRANRIMTCSNCKEEGHYKNTCRKAFVPSSPKKPRGRPRKYQVRDYILKSHKLKPPKLNPHNLTHHKLPKLTPHKLKHHDGKFLNLPKHHRLERGEDGSLRTTLLFVV
ncbi:uncharacterized protein LOC108839209 [Raphanus sativus]|uniref:Uncharacterized protein LOC108839209 n=1 Tax=Raphanus sativus TaxID=3726 RepID=A0A9W3CZX8_RAPSA|nr:uncharacterized protein LOC108839209 [Raphanus sativus]